MSSSTDFSWIKTRVLPHNVIIIGDFLKDLDDEHTLCGAAGLIKLGLIDLKCVVGNLDPAEIRARGAKGTLKLLELKDIPVGIGMPVFEGKNYPYEANIPYLATTDEVLTDGEALLVDSLGKCDDASVILVLQSGMTDAASLISRYPILCQTKIKNVAIMGGVETDLDSEGLITPNNANNNSFDMKSALYLYRQLQLLDIPMIVTTREVAYAAQVPFSAYDQFEATGNPVGLCLKNRQLPALQHLWEAACSPEGSEIRGTLPSDRDRKWFVKVFCAGNEPNVEDGGDIWPFVGSFNLYDPSNLYAAIPEIQSRFLTPRVIKIRDTDHQIFGTSSSDHGVIDVQAFANFMVDIELFGLS